MDQKAGETITLRALGPLPDLASVVFVFSKNRDFVTGRGSLGVSVRPWAQRLLHRGTWLLLGAGILICLGVGAVELYERQQRSQLEATLRTVDAQVVGCDQGASAVPYFRYTAEGKIYNHYPPQTLADMCDARTWQITYIAGDPDTWAVAPDSPLPPFEDSIDAIWIAVGPLLLLLAGFYWMFSWIQDRRAARESRLVKEGALVGAELLSIKYDSGGEGSLPSVRVKFRVTLPDGQSSEGEQTVWFFDLDRRKLPPAGSKLLVLRIDEALQHVL